MKINFGTVLTQLNGQPIENEAKQPFTLGQAVVNALLQPVQGQSAADKIRKGRIAERAYDEQEIEVSPEDVTLIRQAIGELYAPLIVLKVFRLLGGEEAANVTNLKAV
jgi:hypothetical protein